MSETPENCTHDCSSCGASCAQRDPKSLLEPAHPLSRIKKVIAVMSGKGGVGKSSVTAGLASAMSKLGYRVGVLDGDITGPSIPQAFGIHSKAGGSDRGLLPEYSAGGVAVMSLNLLLNHETDPVIWRGAILASAVKQFWTDVIWGDIDYLFVDMPPGTGDIPMTVFQSLPVDGIIIVTSPQDLVSMIVSKAIKMANLMEKPVLGLVENYSYFQCPDCGKTHHIFGESQLDRIATENHLPVLARIPIDPAVASSMDQGTIESLDPNYLMPVAEHLLKQG
jgi:Mrp family chromosome partitioning ATPase